jgi:hypothetical protein
LLCSPLFGQQAYTWTDENGQVHYSDRPYPGATPIQLRGAQGYSAPAAVSPAGAAPESTSPQGAAATRPYNVFNVLQPSQQETLWNTGSVLDVQVDLSPGLQQGHHLGAYLDGQLIDVGARSTQFQLPDVFRGLHTLQAVVLDTTGREVLRSLAVTFIVQQTSILNPNNAASPNTPGTPNTPNTPNAPNQPNTPNAPNTPNRPSTPPSAPNAP